MRPAIGLAVLAIGWQVMSYQNPLLFPSLETLLLTLHREITSGRLIADATASTSRVIIGVIFAAALAGCLGLISGLFAKFSEYLYGLVELTRPIPPIAWAPVAIVFFGVGDAPAIAIVALGAFFPIWLGTIKGISEVKEAHRQAALSLGAGKWLLFTDVVLPSAWPYFLHGLGLGVGLGWFCVVAAEMLGASSGLGFGIQLFSLNLEMERLYIYLLSIGLLGFITHRGFLVINKKLGRSQL